MDDLLREFSDGDHARAWTPLTTSWCGSSRSPNNAKILDNIFRLVHTIKGTCGFLGLAAAEKRWRMPPRR